MGNATGVGGGEIRFAWLGNQPHLRPKSSLVKKYNVGGRMSNAGPDTSYKCRTDVNYGLAKLCEEADSNKEQWLSLKRV